MIKNILRLLTTSTSLVALLLVTNSAIAITLPAHPVTQVKSSTVSLNVISPTLQLIGDGNNQLLDHLGCSCAVCTSGIN